MGAVQRLTWGAVTAAILAGGCLQIPENDPYFHRDDPNSTRYEGLCICYAKADHAITTMNPVTACDVPAKYVFYSNVEPKLRENCDLGDSQFTECYLAEVFADASGGFGCAHHNSCLKYGCCYSFDTKECRDRDPPLPYTPQCDTSDLAVESTDLNCLGSTARLAPPAGPSSWTLANVTSGTLTISTSEGSGSSSITGRLAFVGGNCATGSCPFTLVDLSLTGTNFSISGKSITDPVVINTTLGSGTLFADSSVFTMPAQALQVYSTGHIDGDRMGLLAMSATAGFGIINQRSRQLVFAQTFGLSNGTIDVQLTATIQNLMPSVSLADQTLECNSNGGSHTTLSANVSDADGRVVRVDWFVDGVEQSETSSTLDTFLGLGSHTIEVGAFDNDGGFSSAKATVVVQDTTPPQISTDPVCIWPPDHDLYVIDASAVHVVDACDPNVSVTLLSGVSDQAGDGTGDGHTGDDIFVHPDAACVRAERDGSALYGRTYTIAATATDAASNTSSFTFDITVPHDQSPRCLRGGVPVDENDPRCTPAATSSLANPPTIKEPKMKTGGCRVGDSSEGWLCLLTLGLLRRRRG